MRFASGKVTQARPRQAAGAGAGLAAGARRRAGGAVSAKATRRPARAPRCAASAMRCSTDRRATRRCRRMRRSPRNAQFVWFSDFLSPLTRSRATLRRLSRVGGRRPSGAHRRSGGRGFSLSRAAPASKRRAATMSEMLGRAETVARRLSRPLQGAWRNGRRCSRGGWAGPIIAHRTDHAPQTALIALYADMSGALDAAWTIACRGLEFRRAAGSWRRSSLLPAIWWLLRVTPPLPRRVVFPPLRLLLGLAGRGRDAGAHALVAAAAAPDRGGAA